MAIAMSIHQNVKKVTYLENPGNTVESLTFVEYQFSSFAK